MTNQNNGSSSRTILGMILATVIIAIPPVLFEKYTFYLYTIGTPIFFTYSGSRVWFDIIWFVVSGVMSTLVLGRETKVCIVPPLLASLLFIISANVVPLCAVKECYVTSTDGLSPLRDFLLLGSLGVITSAASVKVWYRREQPRNWIDISFQLGVPALVGFALSFYSITHIFAGVSIPYPGNYLQWFLAGAPAGLAGSMMFMDRSNISNAWAIVFSGVSGVFLSLVLSFNLPCEDCSGYPISTASILILAILFTLPALFVQRKIARSKKSSIPLWRGYRRSPTAIVSATIAISIALMTIFYYVPGYQAAVVNGFSGVTNSNFSPVEVGRTFVYSAGYLAIPRIVSKAVGVNVSFGNTTIDQTKFPNDFLAAGVGDQSPNCCTDGLDLSYRVDAIQFSNGTEAVLARAWWACDTNMACGGYSWQQVLHLGLKDIPFGTLSNWVGLEMNWTSNTSIQWFYRITYSSNHTSTPWMLFSSFTPPKIQNHYWDAGLFPVAPGNPPTGYAYFYQFGVSSAYPIKNSNWHISMQCPDIVINGSWMCLPKAGFVNGLHSYWKVIYTFGETYSGINFLYLGDHNVEFFYSGKSPVDGTPIW